MRYKLSHKETGLWILLAVAACFAIGSVGFFLAALMQKGGPTTTTLDPQQLLAIQEQKDAAMQSLAASQASSTSPDVAVKLQILAKLNAR